MATITSTQGSSEPNNMGAKINYDEGHFEQEA